MFGYIISGQVPNTTFERVSETQFLSNLTVGLQCYEELFYNPRSTFKYSTI